jgi:quinol monooxygenase YgiN
VIFIVVKWQIRADKADEWPELVDEFTQAVRAEPGNIFFEWSRSLESPNEYILVEAFQDGAGEAHVNSDHFKKALEWMPDVVTATPGIIYNEPEGNGWGEMAEVKPRNPA